MSRRREYTKADVTKALAAYVRTGSVKAAQKETGVPWETIRDWKSSAKWADLLAEIRQEHDDEIRRLWLGAARDAAEGLQEAVLRCRQGLRRPELKDRDAALIGRTLLEVIQGAHAMREEMPEPKQPMVVNVWRGVGIPFDLQDDPGAAAGPGGPRHRRKPQ